MDSNYTAEFENWLARRNHVKYAVTCHSGTQALEILAAWNLERNLMFDPPRVLIPTMTYVATANAFARAGYEVVLLDTDGHGQADYRKLDPGLDCHVEVLVGLYGMALPDNAGSKTTVVFEDAAQHWLSADSRRVGLAAAISFDPMKNLNSYGNGGAIVTNSLDIMHYARSWRNNGKPDHSVPGTNSRMSEVDCAQMMVKTRYIDAWQQRRAVIARYWMERLERSGIRSLIDKGNFATHAYHKFVIELDQRDQLRQYLETHKIETKIHYQTPVHEMSAYRDFTGPDILSAASSLARRCVSLPLYPELADLEVEYIIDTVLNYASTKHN